MPQRHVGFTKGLEDSEVAQQFCIPLGTEVVKELDWAILSVLFFVFAVWDCAKDYIYEDSDYVLQLLLSKNIY